MYPNRHRRLISRAALIIHSPILSLEYQFSTPQKLSSMDFHSLARRDLQALCKKNKIPANQTNLLMADALQALATVEGLDDFLNQSEPSVESPEKAVEPSSVAPRTGCRTTTRKKPIEENPQSSVALTRTRRTTRKTEGAEVPVTPAVPSSRKKAPVTRRKMETQFDEEAAAEKKASETPAVRTTRRTVAASVPKVCSSRRSTRTLEKQLMGMDLNAKEESSMDVDGKSTDDQKAAVSDDVLVKTDDLEKPEQTADVIDASDEQKDQEAVSDDVLVKTDDLEKPEQIADVIDASDEQKDQEAVSVDVVVKTDDSEDLKEKPEQIDASDEQKDEAVTHEKTVFDDVSEKTDDQNLKEKAEQIAEIIDASDEQNDENKDEDVSKMEEVTESCHIGSSEVIASDNFDEISEKIDSAVELTSEIKNPTESVMTESGESYMIEDSDKKELKNEVQKQEMEDDLTEPASEEDSEDEVMSYTEEISKSDIETEDEKEEDNVDNSETLDFETLEAQEAETAVDSNKTITYLAPTAVKKSPFKASSITPMKNSPFKAPTSSQKMIEILDENVDVAEKEEVEKEEVSKESSNNNDVVELGKDISLRQLRKLFKTKLQISKEGKNIAEVGGDKRQALQVLPENCLTATDVERHD